MLDVDPDAQGERQRRVEQVHPRRDVVARGRGRVLRLAWLQPQVPPPSAVSSSITIRPTENRKPGAAPMRTPPPSRMDSAGTSARLRRSVDTAWYRFGSSPSGLIEPDPLGERGIGGNAQGEPVAQRGGHGQERPRSQRPVERVQIAAAVDLGKFPPGPGRPVAGSMLLRSALRLVNLAVAPAMNWCRAISPDGGRVPVDRRQVAGGRSGEPDAADVGIVERAVACAGRRHRRFCQGHPRADREPSNEGPGDHRQDWTLSDGGSPPASNGSWLGQRCTAGCWP